MTKILAHPATNIVAAGLHDAARTTLVCGCALALMLAGLV